VLIGVRLILAIAFVVGVFALEKKLQFGRALTNLKNWQFAINYPSVKLNMMHIKTLA